MWFTLRYLYLATVVLCLEQPRVQNAEEVKQSFHFRRAVDGTRGRKYFNPYEDGSYDSYGSGGGHYDASEVQSGFSNIRSNVPGEPGIDYPAYERVPKTRFSCEGRSQGYYADEEAGCQAFHVCHDVVVSSFICPLGSIFSQELLTCDWWNKVDCGMTRAHSSHQGIYNNRDEMIHKAFTMTTLPADRNIVKSDSQNGREVMNTVNIGFGGNGAASPSRETQYYNIHPTTKPEIHENFGFGRNHAVSKTPFEKNIINVSLRPKNFEVNDQAQRSRSYNGAEDSSIFYVQKQIDTSFQDRYTTSRPATFGNIFRNSYQQDKKIFRNEFQPSYAPTVPTVTTTTRRLYSPTVPTTYRPSTLSYNNYDQYFDGSDHLYTHSRNTNVFTTGSTIDYDTVRVGDRTSTNAQHQANQQSNDADRTAANNEQYENNFAEAVQTEESIGIAQSYGGRLNKVEDHSGEKPKSRIGIDVRLGEPKKQDTYPLRSESNLESTTSQLGTKSTSFDSNLSGNQQSYQHFYSNRLSRGRKQDDQVTGKVDSISVNNFTQIEGTMETRNESNLNSIEARVDVPPLVVQIPRPLGTPGRPVTDIADQLFTYDSFIKMSSSVPQSASSVEQAETNSTSTRIPPLIPQASQFSGSSGQNSTNLGNRIQTPDSSTRIPPLIPQPSQSAASSGAQSSIGIGDTTAFSSRPKVPSLISQDSQIVGTSGGIQSIESSTRIPSLIPQASQSVVPSEVTSTNFGDEAQTFDSPIDVPPLIPQPSLSASSGAQSTIGNSDTTAFSSRPKVPSLISQDSQFVATSGGTQSIESSSRIPPLISQVSQSAASSGTQSATGVDDDTTFGSPPRIPPQISQNSQSMGSPEIHSTDVDDGTQTLDPPFNIPPLIPQPTLSAASTGAQSTSDIDGGTTFDSPPRIPPLSSQSSQSVGLSEIPAVNVDDGIQSLDSPIDIPPLIPQSSQSAASSGAQHSTDIIRDDTTFGSPPRVPPLISQNSQSVGLSETPATNVDDGTQDLDLPIFIPPLIPPSSQSAASSGAQPPTANDRDDPTFGPPPKIPSLMSQNSQSVGLSETSATNIDDGTQDLDLPVDIPPLIPQSSQSAASSGAQHSTDINRDDTTFGSPPRVPPLISQNSQSVGLSETPATNVDEGTQDLDLPISIPPLIPQSSQSAASSGAKPPTAIDRDDTTFGSPPRIPSLISQNSPSVGLSETPATNVDEEMQDLDIPIYIPPLIPQSSQSGALPGAESTTVIDGNTAFGSSPRVPPLISQTSQSSGSSDNYFTNVDDGTQTLDSPINIPPLIRQPSKSATSSETQSSGAIDDDTTLDSPSRIPPLISSNSEFVGSSEISSTNVDDGTQSFDSPINIPPLIPQSSQSTVSSGAPSLPSRIPALISQNSQSVGSSGVHSTNVHDRTQLFDSSTRIPPLIPQSAQFASSSGAQGPTVTDDHKTFGTPSREPSLISQNSQSVGSSGVHSTNVHDRTQLFDSSTRIPPLIPQSAQIASSSGAHGPTVTDDSKIFGTPSREPSLISQNSQSVGSSGVHFTNVYDRTQLPDSSSRIPPLISQSAQFASSSGAQGPTVIDDHKIFGTPSREPSLVSQNSQSVGSSGVHLTNVHDRTQLFDSSTRIPPLIPQSAQTAPSSGANHPTAIEDNKTFGSPPRKPPLISQISQFTGPSGVHSWNVDGGTQNVESSSRIPPLISQSSQYPLSSEIHSPCGVHETNTFHGPPKIQPLISQIPQSIGSPGVNLPHDIDQTQTFVSSTEIPQSISQNKLEDSPIIYPTYGGGEQHIGNAPPRVPPLISQISRPLGLPGTHSTNIFNQGQSLYSSDKRPSLISRPADSSATYSNNAFNSFNVFSTTPQPTYFTFQGQYQRPLPFNSFQTPTELPPVQFVTTPVARIPDDDFNVQYGSKIETETSTISPSGGSVDFGDKEFRIHVPDFPSTETVYSTPATIPSIPTNPPLSGISSLESSDGQSFGIDHTNEKSSNVASHTEQTTLRSPEVVTHLPAVDHQQSLVTEFPNIVSASPSPEDHSYSTLSTENNKNEESHTEIRAPTHTLPGPHVHHSNYNSFEQDSVGITSITNNDRPVQQQLRPSQWKYDQDLQFTIRGAQLYPTATPFPSSTLISSTYLPQSTETPSGVRGQKVVNLDGSNTADGSTHSSYPENPARKEYQESTTAFHRVTSAENNFIPTSSHSPFDNFGYSKERFEANTLKSVLDPTNIKSAENVNPSSNGLLQALGESSLSSGLPLSLGQIESSPYNGNDSPYELHFTVNADEEFDPSADFISKLLAQYEGNSSLGLDSFGGFEIIKSDSAGGPDDEGDVSSTALPNIVPSEPPMVQRLLFDVRGSFSNQPIKPKNGSVNLEPNSGTPIPKASETRPTELDQPKPSTRTEQPNRPTGIEKPSDFSRPNFFASTQNAALQTAGLNVKSDDLPIINLPHLGGNVKPAEQLPSSIDLPKLRIGAKDINRSLESLFEFVPPTIESSPLKKQDILQELTKNFGQPLYYRDYQGSVVSSNADNNAGQQFANLQQYKVRQNGVSDQEPKTTSPSPPKPSSTTTPEPIKTVVETEFIPSLSFSFDSDDGRNEYVEAVLQGLLTEHQPAYPWNYDPEFYRKSRENSKPSNDTAKV